MYGGLVIGVGIGIGLTGKGAMEAIGRQPDSGKIQVAALILAALVEGIGSLHFCTLRTKKHTVQLQKLAVLYLENFKI